MAVTPQPGLVTVIAAGGAAQICIPANPNGGFITNPVSPADQGLGSAEPLYINPVSVPGAGDGNGNGATFVLYPGQTWTVIPGQTTPTYVNALSTGHAFSAIFW